VAALLLRRELVLEVHTGGSCFDERLHELEGVEGAAEAGLCVCDDRREPVAAVVPLGMLDLIRTEERVVDAPRERGSAAAGVEALVRVDLGSEVRVGCHLPAAQIDGLETRLHHLHRLSAGHRSERGDVLALLEELPQPLGAEPRQRVLDMYRAP
jgi:hypothetical protein